MINNELKKVNTRLLLLAHAYTRFTSAVETEQPEADHVRMIEQTQVVPVYI